MIDNQQGDVLLFQTNDEGDIAIEGGITQMSGSFETAFYLSLFGGNELDSGLLESPKAYWGNLLENEEQFKYKSRTQYLLRSIPVTSGNLSKINKAAEQDLQWFLDLSISNKLLVSSSLIGLNKIQISISIEASGKEESFNFVENWKSGL